MDILEDLEYRGIISQTTDFEALKKRLEEGPITLYGGFDPTADSMHVGNLFPILILRRFQLAGHKVIALAGGATGLIGDPGGRSSERQLNTLETVKYYNECIKNQLKRFIDFESQENPATLVNNYDWISSLSTIDFLRDVGKHYQINYMLAKDSVQSRLERGLSFTEFSYMILQGYDFYVLNRDYNCELQLGGNDQWGNITSGMELIRRKTGKQVHCITNPLVTKSDGTKFGKSESGAIWLDADKTSPYQLYQFWINSDDKDVIQYIKFYTFLSKEEIDALEERFNANPGAREAQKVLAQEVTTLIHGKEATERAEKVSQLLFNGNVSELLENEIEDALSGVPSATINEDIALLDLMINAKVAASKREAREFIQNGAVYINGEKCNDLEKVITKNDSLFGKYIIIKRGKKNYYLVKFE